MLGRGDVKSLSRMLFILTFGTFAACGGKDSNSGGGGGGGGGNPAAAATAKTIFEQRCVPCHGTTGQGDGPASAQLNPKPRKYADKAWQASVTDADIEKIIKVGGQAVGKSPLMPANPDLTDPAVVSALKDIVRGFGK